TRPLHRTRRNQPTRGGINPPSTSRARSRSTILPYGTAPSSSASAAAAASERSSAGRSGTGSDASSRTSASPTSQAPSPPPAPPPPARRRSGGARAAAGAVAEAPPRARERREGARHVPQRGALRAREGESGLEGAASARGVARRELRCTEQCRGLDAGERA